MICALCFMISIALTSCLTLSPPQEQVKVGGEIEHTISVPQSKLVIWKSARVTGQSSTIEATKMPQSAVSVKAGDTSPNPPAGMVLIPGSDFLMGSKKGEGMEMKIRSTRCIWTPIL